MPELSIIVPVYNTEQYLPKCIESILAQTFTDIECILIDDGSTDNSGKICDEYAEKDDRIIVIHQPNTGVSSARNKGLKIMRGQYVGFVDSDDWIEPEMYKRMMNSAGENNSDLVFCSWYENSMDGTQKANAKFKEKDCLLSVDDFYKGLFSSPRTVAGACWNKVFRRESIKNGFDESISICEDNLFVAEFIHRDTIISYVSEHFYHIYQRAGSAIRENFEKLIPSLNVRLKIIDICGAVSVTGRDYAELDYLNMASYYFAETNSNEIIRKQIHRYVRNNPLKLIKNHAINRNTKIFYFLQ